MSHDRFANQTVKNNLITALPPPNHCNPLITSSTPQPLTPPLLLPRTPTTLSAQTRPRTRPSTPATTQTRALFALTRRTALPPTLAAQRLQTGIYRSRQSVRRVRRVVGFPVDLCALVVGGEAGEQGEEVEAGLGQGLCWRKTGVVRGGVWVGELGLWGIDEPRFVIGRARIVARRTGGFRLLRCGARGLCGFLGSVGGLLLLLWVWWCLGRVLWLGGLEVALLW